MHDNRQGLSRTLARWNSLFTGPLVLLAFVAGCAKKDDAAGGAYTGSWAQVADILSRVKPPTFPDRDFNIKGYGAVGDGETDCKKAIDKAVLACCYAEGGRVVVPAGTYLINGPIHLQSDTNLHLEEGAKIVFGTNFADYLPPALTRFAGTRIYNYSPMIYAYRKKNVAVTGKGELDAQAHDTWCAWVGKSGGSGKEVRRMNREDVPVMDRMFGEGHKLRPSMVQFFGCENVLVEGIKIVDAPAWCLHPVFSKNVTIRNISFNSKNANNDGIDVDSCEDVHIHDVVFDNADDCIALKSGRGPEGRKFARPTKNVYIHDCIFNSYTAIAIGSEMGGGVFNIFAENCEARSQVKRAFYIKGNRSRGGEVAHIRYRNMKFLDSREEMLAIRTDYGTMAADELKDFPPYFHDVRWENITASGSCKIALRIAGQEDMPIEDVVLKDIRIEKADKIKEITDARNIVMQNVILAGEIQDPNAANLPPDVYAGPDRIVDPNGDKTAVLQGSVADDGPTGKLKYQWSVEKGDSGAVMLDNPQAIRTKAVFSKAGAYVLKLTADDGELKGSHTLTIEVMDDSTRAEQ
ncbi:MAG: glycoside hydrolase family 28 protein [Phycisphaerae bacterium]|nr:glycoside hydrolase family 28 protein [Phycisphaerae bacterium]